MHFYFWVLLFLVALLFSVCSFMCVYFWPVIPTVRSNRGLNISRHGGRYFTTCISINVAGSSGELINLLLLLWSSMVGCWSGVFIKVKDVLQEMIKNFLNFSQHRKLLWTWYFQNTILIIFYQLCTFFCIFLS